MTGQPQWVERASLPTGTWKVVGSIKGPPGEGATYEHLQTTPAASWTVMHGLGTYAEPLVILDSDPAHPVYTDFEYVDSDVIVVLFPEPVTGRAYVSN